MDNIIKQLEQVISARKSTKAGESYVASLYNKGLNEILKKIGEEATEVVIAAKDDNKEQIIHEIADLCFHVLVLMNHENINSEQIEQELSNRFGISGITEKINRNN